LEIEVWNLKNLFTNYTGLTRKINSRNSLTLLAK